MKTHRSKNEGRGQTQKEIKGLHTNSKIKTDKCTDKAGML